MGGRIEKQAQTASSSSVGRGMEEANPWGSFACQTRRSQLLLLSYSKPRTRDKGRWMLGTPISPPPAREANVQLSQPS